MAVVMVAARQHTWLCLWRHREAHLLPPSLALCGVRYISKNVKDHRCVEHDMVAAFQARTRRGEPALHSEDRALSSRARRIPIELPHRWRRARPNGIHARLCGCLGLLG